MLIRSAQGESAAPSIELTPIIDMVFLLLIFFLVATTFKQSEREMQIALPETESGGPISMSLKELIVNVAGDGSIVVAGQTVEPESLRAMVAEAVKNNPQQKVTVRGDKNASYGTMARVLDICKAAGVQEPYLDTVPVR